MSYLRKHKYGLLVIGCIAMFIAILSNEYLPTLRDEGFLLSQEPFPVSLVNLAAVDLSEPVNIRVTEYTCGNSYAYEITDHKGAYRPTYDDVGQSQAWIPLFPKAPKNKISPESQPKKFRVLLETKTTRASPKEHHVMSRRPSIDVIAMPMTNKQLSREVRKTLKEHYAETDLDRCILLVEYAPSQTRSPYFWANVLAGCRLLSFAIGLLTLFLAVYFIIRNPR